MKQPLYINRVSTRLPDRRLFISTEGTRHALHGKLPIELARPFFWFSFVASDHFVEFKLKKVKIKGNVVLTVFELFETANDSNVVALNLNKNLSEFNLLEAHGHSGQIYNTGV